MIKNRHKVSDYVKDSLEEIINDEKWEADFEGKNFSKNQACTKSVTCFGFLLKFIIFVYETT